MTQPAEDDAITQDSTDFFEDLTDAYRHTYPNRSRVRVRPSAVDIWSDVISQEFSVDRPP